MSYTQYQSRAIFDSGMDADVCFMCKDGRIVRIPELLEAWHKANS